MKVLGRLFFVGLLAFIFALAGCSTAPSLDPYVGASASDQIDLDRLSEYRLGIADRLRILVYNEPQISAEYVVNEKGYVSIALIGEIRAAGLTLSEFQESLRQKLADGYLQDPRVSAEITQYRPYYVLGEVARPGEFAYKGDLTVMNAVAIAGGFTYRANKSVVFVKHTDWEEEQKLKLTPGLRVYPGDIIRVGERFF